MSLSSILFIDSLPKLDLHGYDSDTARMLINDYIKEQQKLKNDTFTIIHGIGSGIIRKTTQETLKRHKMVLEYQMSFFNQGCTIVKIKI